MTDIGLFVYQNIQASLKPNKKMEQLFLHVCCGPCAVFPVTSLLELHPQLDLALWFYNPNIQPRSEYQKRRDSLAYLWYQLSNLSPETKAPKLLFSTSYNPQEHLALTSKSPEAPERCRLCYRLRLSATAHEAALRGYRYFSTTLLFSKQQKHELIIEEGLAAAKEALVDFYYEDFRLGWKKGQELARNLGLYRQNYCGCVYS